MNLRLVRPEMEMENAHRDYINEWRNAGEEVSPWSTDPRDMDYATWLEKTIAVQQKDTCPPNLVPADTYFLMGDRDRILGAINIRHELNDFLLRVGGHIGYGVRPSERGKGYAATMLEMALGRCREIGLERVLVICDSNNIASAATIKRNRGVLENEVLDGERVMQRYWIRL